MLAAALVSACAPATARRTASGGPTRTPVGTALTPPTGTPLGRPGGPAVEIGHGPRTTAAVALTFHGAGDPALARALLGEAERAGGRVTVLAVGSWLDANPSMARRILDGGHDLGNHTQTHQPMLQLDAAACDREIVGCRQVLQRLTGGPGRWFRPSGTAHANSIIEAAAGRAGYRNTLSYDVDPQDYTDPGANAVVERTLAAVTNGSIVSLHLGHAGTVAALPAILTGLDTRGLRAVTVSHLLGYR